MYSIIQKGLFILLVQIYFLFSVKAHLQFAEGMQLFLFTFRPCDMSRANLVKATGWKH